MGEMVRCGRRAAHGSEPDDDVSIIGPGMEVLGGINGEGSVRVEGKVGGPVRTSGSLVVGKGGRVVGDVEASEVVIAGTVVGDIVGVKRVELRTTGRIKGDIATGRMKVDEGAQYQGRLRSGDAASDTAANSSRLVNTRGDETKSVAPD